MDDSPAEADIELPYTRVPERAEAVVEPAYATPGDAGLDLTAAVSGVIRRGGGRQAVPVGVRAAIPAGYAGFVMPRSGLALRHGVTVLNTPGLIDSGYRGEWKVVLCNTDPDEDFVFDAGERIAQLVILAVPSVRLVPVDELDETVRGDGGFGHTGR